MRGCPSLLVLRDRTILRAARTRENLSRADLRTGDNMTIRRLHSQTLRRTLVAASFSLLIAAGACHSQTANVSGEQPADRAASEDLGAPADSGRAPTAQGEPAQPPGGPGGAGPAGDPNGAPASAGEQAPQFTQERLEQLV